MRRAGGRLDGDDAGLLALLDVLAHEREGDAGEVGAAAHAADHEVGIGAGQLHLLEGFLADDGLMEQHVVEHRAQRVVGVVALSGHFDRFADGDAQAARGIRVLRPGWPGRTSVVSEGLGMTSAPHTRIMLRR